MAISVIIPTIQIELSVLKKLVQTLTKDPEVDEILIINNKPETQLPENIITEKVEVITPKENLYVNGSWNLGVKLAKNDKFVLMNDDLLVCKDFCSLVLESGILDDESTGLIGASPYNIKFFDNKRMPVPKIAKDTKPNIIQMNKYLHTGDWGISIFGRKDSYYEIPDDFKIIYGDNYLLHENIKNNKTNYQITNLPFHHIHSASCSSGDFKDIVVNDIENSKNYFPLTEESV